MTFLSAQGSVVTMARGISLRHLFINGRLNCTKFGAIQLKPLNKHCRIDSDGDILSEISTTMARLWINHDFHRRCLLISHSNLVQNSPNMFSSLPISFFIMQRRWWIRARIFACKQPQQSRLCMWNFLRNLRGGGEESQRLLMFYSSGVRHF